MGRFGPLIKRKRREQNLTLRDLSQHTAMSVPYLSAIERGKRQPPDSSKIELLAKALSVSIEELQACALEDRKQIDYSAESSEQVKSMLVSLTRTLETRQLSDEMAHEIEQVLKRNRGLDHG